VRRSRHAHFIRGREQGPWQNLPRWRFAVVAPPGEYTDIALSPDENQVAFDQVESAAPDVWLLDLRRSVTLRFTYPSVGIVLVWSPDARVVAFAARGRGLNIHQRPSNASGPDEVLLTLDAPPIMFPSDWSSDGRYLTYYRTDLKTQNDVWVLPLFGDRKPLPVLNGEFNWGRMAAGVDQRSGRVSFSARVALKRESR
jgi:eukaryotic-like serine/threonine-protein kinase